MSKRLTTEEFIERATAKHGNAYDYSQTRYVDQQTKVDVVCPVHGTFSMLPANHYWKGQRCPKCAEASRRANKTKSHVSFLEEAQSIHQHKYEYLTHYTHQRAPIEMWCPNHGAFSMTPNAHISGKQGCPKCAGKHKTRDDWLHDFRLTHGDRYDYAGSVVISSHAKISIGCNKHGRFYQTPAMHKSGQGCPSCAYEDHKGRYSSTFFKRYPELTTAPAFVYVLKFTNDTEQFLKIGITSTTVEQRVRNTRTQNYMISILVQYPLSLYDAFIIEQRVLDLMHTNRYTPREKFHGQTECLNIECYEDIIKIIREGAHII